MPSKFDLETDVTFGLEANETIDGVIYRSILDHLLHGVAYCRIICSQGRPDDFLYLYVNSAFERQTGLKDVIGKPVSLVIPTLHETDPQLFDIYGRVAKGEPPQQLEIFVEALALWFLISVYSPKPGYFVCIFDDITVRKRAEQELHIAETAFDSYDGMMITDADNRILRINKAFSKITGYSSAEVVGRTPSLLKSGLHQPEFYESLWNSIHNIGVWEGEILNKRKNGDVYPDHLTITAVKNETGGITHFVATHSDITLSKTAEIEIKNLAFFDPLTHLPNRRLLLDRLTQSLVYSARHGTAGALLFIDLDNFKVLNDTLGHDIGDLLLQQVAQRLTACVREGDTVARLGGDEFLIMLEDLSRQVPEAAAQAKVIAEKILCSLNLPYQLGAHEFRCSCSIGVALFNDHELPQDELLKHADIAMYQAKKAGRNTLRFYDPQMQANIMQRVALENQLRVALEERQLRLFYQVQVNSAGQGLGAEALIRWEHPQRGLLLPEQFILLAEETGLILPIGLWVLETACAQLLAWQADERLRDLMLSVNVSAKQFHQDEFVNHVKSALQRYSIKPGSLKLELTESALLNDIEDTIATMNALGGIGVQFSLDDFGAGYSSLQYLKRLPLFQLKIDRSFVRDIAHDSNDQAIVRTIVAMAHGMDLNVIAEGVETKEQKLFLQDFGCTNFQGFLFGKPLPLDEYEAVLMAGTLLKT